MLENSFKTSALKRHQLHHKCTNDVTCHPSVDQNVGEVKTLVLRLFISFINFFRSQLYCELTKKYINNTPHHIQTHVTGKRFLRALEKREYEVLKHLQ